MWLLAVIWMVSSCFEVRRWKLPLESADFDENLVLEWDLRKSLITSANLIKGCWKHYRLGCRRVLQFDSETKIWLTGF